MTRTVTNNGLVSEGPKFALRAFLNKFFAQIHGHSHYTNGVLRRQQVSEGDQLNKCLVLFGCFENVLQWFTMLKRNPKSKSHFKHSSLHPTRRSRNGNEEWEREKFLELWESRTMAIRALSMPSCSASATQIYSPSTLFLTREVVQESCCHFTKNYRIVLEKMIDVSPFLHSIGIWWDDMEPSKNP